MSQGPRGFVVLAAIVLTSAARADVPDREKKEEGQTAERKALDALLYTTLRDVINRGVDLYNAGNTAGCYRVFEGSLLTVRPLLGHHPEAQKIISRSLTGADRDPVAWRRAFTLRDALDKVRAELSPRKKRDEKVSPPPDNKKPAPPRDNEKKPETKKEEEKLPRPRIEEDNQGDKDER